MLTFEECFKYEMKCFGCSKLGVKDVLVFSNETEYQQHYMEKHNNNKLTKYNLTCLECGKINKSWYNFVAHTTTHRKYCNPPYICNYPSAECDKRCSTKHNLIKHIQSHHDQNIVINKNNHNSKNIKPEKYKNQNNKMVNPTSSNTTKRRKKLRPKINHIPTQTLNSRKRRLSDIDDNDNDNDDDDDHNYVNNDQPKNKRMRIHRDIKSQIQFLNLLHYAAIYIDQNDKYVQNNLDSSSDLSPQSPLL